LGDGDLHTEIDAVVIAPKCITILEAKNTKKNIFIDEVGNYYRTGEFLKLDYNIAEKMDTKETLLRKVLDDAGYENIKINSILVFTNNRIEVHNKCNRIITSFISQLPSIIEGYRLEDAISVEEMERIEGVIAAADSKIEYPFEFDVAQYKRDFANLMVKLEFGYEPCEETVMDNSPIRTEKTARKIVKKNITRQSLTPKELLHAGITAATIGTLAVVSFPLAAFYGVVIPRSIHRADCT
jgi:hypothetical protein